MIRSTYLLTIVMLFGKKQSFVMDENETIILYGTLLTFVMVFTKCLWCECFLSILYIAGFVLSIIGKFSHMHGWNMLPFPEIDMKRKSV